MLPCFRKLLRELTRCALMVALSYALAASVVRSADVTIGPWTQPNIIGTNKAVIGEGTVFGVTYSGISTNELAFSAAFGSYPHILTGNGTPPDNGWIYGILAGGYHSFEVATVPYLLIYSNKQAITGPLTVGSVSTFINGAAGELGFTKIGATGTAPGVGTAKMEWVAGTAGGTCKLIAYAGTSTTPSTIVDNVGGGC